MFSFCAIASLREGNNPAKDGAGGVPGVSAFCAIAACRDGNNPASGDDGAAGVDAAGVADALDFADGAVNVPDALPDVDCGSAAAEGVSVGTPDGGIVTPGSGDVSPLVSG